ncbi:CvpA family protein [Candidatus Vesicomyidisocius sp. SY067_SCS001]|uniref:CvpA family protein n=1 Tax=Candidatus Vesicomyidisocius sp. SY067_SCS001 TaxID=2732590 RepID=UPI00168287B7|nr:CvpA family protein [Candidatus Vesicomyosocius sp. SY067_SCS001]
MNEFFITIWSIIERLVWSDWIIIAILAIFIILGFKRGLAKELINLSFLLLAMLIALLFYQILATSSLIIWLTPSHQSHLTISFGIIFICIVIIKKLSYKLTQLSLTIDNPCVLNKLFALTILFTAITIFSCHHLDIIGGLDIIEMLIGNKYIRISLSFIILFSSIFGIFTFISKILNISIDKTKPCFLLSFFEKILKILQAIDIKLNARNINSIQNSVLGSMMGLIKANLVILIIVLMLQNISWVSQQYYWIETNGALKIFQDIASNIKPELSQYLLFINNN